jgi:thiol-disulfide isomerase/thioredoxin
MTQKQISRLFNILFIGMALFLIGRYIYMLPAYSKGETAPDFAIGVRESGDSLYLSDLQGSWVLIDFWGSWCPPCRRENPKLVALYQKFRSQEGVKKSPGFEIVSVGIERNTPSWERAIQADRLSWPYHVLDKSRNLKFFDGPIADKYEIKKIPTKYLIDENQQIIAVDPSIQELNTLLSGR